MPLNDAGGSRRENMRIDEIEYATTVMPMKLLRNNNKFH
jgi:hypothetical protein